MMNTNPCLTGVEKRTMKKCEYVCTVIFCKQIVHIEIDLLTLCFAMWVFSNHQQIKVNFLCFTEIFQSTSTW